MQTPEQRQRDVELCKAYSDYLDEFKERAMEKFIRGRVEHADQDPKKLDFEKEIENELFDITAYNFLKNA